MTDEPQQPNNQDKIPPVSVPPLVPPTPPPIIDEYAVKLQQKQDAKNGINIGCLVMIGCAALAPLSSALGHMLGSMFFTYVPLLFIMAYGIAVWAAYRLKRPFIARGMFIALGVTLLLLIGLCWAISASSH